MKESKKTIGIILTVFLTALLGLFYSYLENYFHNDFDCGYCSTCVGYYPTLTSRLIGYGMLIGSTVLFILSIWRYRGLSKFWIIPTLVIFGIAFYGNGYMIFKKVGCDYSLNKTILFFYQTKLADFAKTNTGTINLDSLTEGKLKGKLLGYSLEGNNLTAFKIGEKPLKVKTSFLFWKVRNNVILNDISHGELNTYRNFKAERNIGIYEFIGGQGMTEKDFLDEFVLTEKEISSSKLKNKKIIKEIDGTTRFLFEVESKQNCPNR